MKLISNYEPGHYSVWFNNCSTVIRRLLYESGYFSSPSIRGLPVTPNGLQKEIEMRNVIRAGAEIYKRYIQQ